MIKIKIEIINGPGYNTVSTVESDGEPNMEHVYQMIKQALAGVGFHPDTISEYFDEA